MLLITGRDRDALLNRAFRLRFWTVLRNPRPISILVGKKSSTRMHMVRLIFKGWAKNSHFQYQLYRWFEPEVLQFTMGNKVSGSWAIQISSMSLTWPYAGCADHRVILPSPYDNPAAQTSSTFLWVHVLTFRTSLSIFLVISSFQAVFIHSHWHSLKLSIHRVRGG